MNDFELHKELERNNSEKQIINTELDASKKKWAEYVLTHKDEINSIHSPRVVKKKKKAKFNDFINKIKAIFGLTKKKENNDGIEAYLQYRNKFE